MRRYKLGLTRGLHLTIGSVMNIDGDSSSDTSCPPPVKTRFFASEINTAPLHRDEEELMGDGETVDDNQDDSELYLADDDGEDFNELAAETSSLASSDSSGFVWNEQGTITAVRVRPMLPSEKKNGYRSIVDMSANNDGLMTRIVNPTALPPLSRSARYTSGKLPLMQSSSATNSVDFPAQFTQEFRFDYSYWSFDRSRGHQLATQSTIYDELGVLALQTVLQGHNCSVFACGQPGAGKTYTMMGTSGERTSLPATAKASGSSAVVASDRRGLIPRICQSLFAELDEGKKTGSSYSVVMSYVEIYDERVYDLLSQATIKKALKVREHPEEGAFVEKSRRVHVTSYTKVLELIDEGNRSRSVTSNHRPPRSHVVLTLSLTQNTPGSSSSMSETPRKSKICLVDLAGSERVDHNGASGLRLREVASVNRSLATLADVVGALAKRKINRSVDGSQRQKTFVPYRNSVLTRLLKECLGGRAKTIMIGAISPCCAHYEESIATLRYIERARSVYSTHRLNGNTSGDTRFLDDVNELKSSLCASDDGDLSFACSQAPEHHNDGLDIESCDQESSNDIQLDEIESEASSKANADERKAPVADLNLPSSDLGQAAGQALMKSVHLLNLAAIRRRSQTLQKFRALSRWKKLVSTDANRAHDREVKPGTRTHNSQGPPAQRSNGQKAGCPPLHTRSTTAESKTLGRVQDVVAAVVTTDAICCSVVQDFLFPHETNVSMFSPSQRSSAATSTSLLELLASSSEFDRSDFLFDLAGDCSINEQPLDEQASPEIWCYRYPKEEEGSFLSKLHMEEERPALERNETSSLLSPGCQGEESSAYSALSLCVDSIDLARRALGPGMRILLCRDSVSGASVECELLRYLDKRFIVITRHLEQLLVGAQIKPSLMSLWKPSESLCEALETMIGEFCLQIISRLCDQLPSALSACVAGRLQLETQLEHFSDRLKRHLLPEMANNGNNCEATEDVNTALLVATELIVMTERIKLVWNFTGHKKRERLLKMQVLEAAAINDRKMAAKIAVLEEKNAQLSARCEAFAAASIGLNDSYTNGLELSSTKLVKRNLDTVHSAITLQQLELEYDGASTPENNLGVKLAVEIARTRDVQARNDELLCRFATLNRALAAASARVTALEAENVRLSSRSDLTEQDSEDNLTTLNALCDRVAVLQTELEDARYETCNLEDQVAKLRSDSLEQGSQLESVDALYSHEKQARTSLEAELVRLRTKADTEIQELRNLLSVADARAMELEVATDKLEERWQTVKVTLVDTQNKNAGLSVSLAEAKTELQSVQERARRAERENPQHVAASASLKTSLTNLQTQKELAEMLAEDLMSKRIALIGRVSLQAGDISVFESRAYADKQRLQELKMQLAIVTQDRDEHMLLLSQTEGTLASALGRENALQSQMKASSANELNEANRLRGELHEATVEIASLREELTELLDHSTLQSTTIEALKLEQAEMLEKVRELEIKRDEVVLQCRVEQVASEQKERTHQAAALHAQDREENLSRLERQQEIQRQESMVVHETLQRRTEAFLKLQAQQHSVKMNYCSTIRDLKAQVATFSTASRASDEKLAAKTREMEAARTLTEAQILKLIEQARASEYLALEREDIARNLATQMQEGRLELAASTRRWIRAETESGLLRVCIAHLKRFLTESKEMCMMQLADVESAHLEKGCCWPSTLASEFAVNEDMRSVDAWFDEVISGNQTTAEIVPALPTAESAVAKESAKARDEDYAARSSLLKTLTDLSALTTELLVVCESTSDPGAQSNNSSAQKVDHNPEHNDTKDDVDRPLNNFHEAISCNEKGDEPQIEVRREEKVPCEVGQLRKIVVKLKEALDAKDDMLLYLDGKVKRLEQLAQ